MTSVNLQTILDDSGINVFDPNDKLGHKSNYITILHEMALQRYLPVCIGQQIAVDVGCGYGRLSKVLRDLGWFSVGIDPSIRLLLHAKRNAADNAECFCQGSLPELPFAHGSVDLILLHNILRPLKLMHKVDFVKDVSIYLGAKGRIVVVDNIREGHKKYFNNSELVQIFTDQNMKLKLCIPIRAGCWWLLYLIRYGFIPKKWLPKIASYELSLRRSSKPVSRWRYMNVMYQFEHNNP